jgi:hypothetical protein
VFTAVVKVGIRLGLDTLGALCNLWMTASNGRKSPKNRHFSCIEGLRDNDSWITLCSVSAALGRQEDVDEQKM